MQIEDDYQPCSAISISHYPKFKIPIHLLATWQEDMQKNTKKCMYVRVKHKKLTKFT